MPSFSINIPGTDSTAMEFFGRFALESYQTLISELIKLGIPKEKHSDFIDELFLTSGLFGKTYNFAYLR